MLGKNSLILGTTKLGNLSKHDSFKFLDEIQNLEIQHIDTAPTYPNSEVLIGKYIQSEKELKIFSKFGREINFLSKREFEISLSNSLKRLNIESLYGVSIHNKPASTFNVDFLDSLTKLKIDGAFKYLGWSGSWNNLPPTHYLDFLDYVMLPINKFIPSIELNIQKIEIPVIAMNPFANFFWDYKPLNPIKNIFREIFLKKFHTPPSYKHILTRDEIPSVTDMIKYVKCFNSVHGICFGSINIRHVAEVVSINKKFLI